VASLFYRSINHAAVYGLAIVAVVGSLLFSPLSSAQAGSAPAATSVIGSVNIQKVLAGYNKKASAEASMQAMADNFNNVFKLEQASAMLSQSDQQSLCTLLLKPTKVQADEDQIKVLQTKSVNDANELATLQQKTSPTDDDKARLTVLTGEQQNGQAALQTIADSFKQQLSDQDQQQSTQLESDVRAAVASVAEQKGLAVVFDSSLAIYASNDVTAQVISKLNSDK